MAAWNRSAVKAAALAVVAGQLTSAGDFLYLAREVEGARRVLNLRGAELQFYQLEGGVATLWQAVVLPSGGQANAWKMVERAALATLKPVYAPPAPAAGEAPRVFEADEMVVRLYGRALEKEARCTHSRACPEAVRALWDHLEAATRLGTAPPLAGWAVLAEDLDVRDYPARRSIYESVQGGVTFAPLSAIVRRGTPSIDSAVARPGWLAPLEDAGQLPEGPPGYVRIGTRHLQLKRVQVQLAN